MNFHLMLFLRNNFFLIDKLLGINSVLSIFTNEYCCDFLVSFELNVVLKFVVFMGKFGILKYHERKETRCVIL